MAYSYVRYTGNGSTTNYVFPFPYINSSHVKVRLNGVLNTNFSFLNASTIQLTTAPASGVVIEIRRETPKDSPIVNFTDGSILLERDLDLLATFDTYIAQETADSLDESIRKDALGVWNGANARIGSVADPVNPQDVATKNYVDTGVLAVIAPSVNAAASSAAAALVSENNASSHKTAAQSAQTAAESARDATLAAYDSFDDRYLGAKSSDPSVDNDGNALVGGTLYFNTTLGSMRLYTGSAWVPSYVPGVASSIGVTPVGNVAATNVQAAIQELDGEKVDKTSDTGSAKIPTGTTAQRDGSPSAGWLRFNTTLSKFEGWLGAAWGAIGGGATGGGNDAVFVENDQTVTANYTLTTGKNAMSAGPITINSGVTVTVPSGQIWTIV